MTFKQRLKVLDKTFSLIDNSNKEYLRLIEETNIAEKKIQSLTTLLANIKTLLNAVTVSEKQWRESILSIIECEIYRYISIVYPVDDYSISLSCSVKYGKIKIQASVSSLNFENLKIESQGRLFKQIVSLAAVVAIMRLKGINTVYVDEAFSGASRENMPIVGSLITELINEGLNMIIIVQNEDIIPGTIGWHSLFLKRNISNCTTIKEEFLGRLNNE